MTPICFTPFSSATCGARNHILFTIIERGTSRERSGKGAINISTPKTEVGKKLLNTIFQKLHFSKSHFCETLQEKYDYIIFLQLTNHKKCRKNFENRFTSKLVIPKNYFESRPFACAREVIHTPEN